jgi:hypothetical protein
MARWLDGLGAGYQVSEFRNYVCQLRCMCKYAVIFGMKIIVALSQGMERVTALQESERKKNLGHGSHPSHTSHEKWVRVCFGASSWQVPKHYRERDYIAK